MRQKGLSALAQLTIAAVLMAMTIALCSFSIPVPFGHLYLCDVAICLAALLLKPPLAMAVGGIGTFLGDLLFYPPSMVVSLVTHGLQALVISLFAHYVLKKIPVLPDVLGLICGIIVLVTGYSLGRAFVYSTPAAVLPKLPFEILQGVIGAGLALVLATPAKVIYRYLTNDSPGY